jgi:hypothetical protein
LDKAGAIKAISGNRRAPGVNLRPLAFAALLLALPAFVGAASADPLNHACSGAVDVHCDDDTEGSCLVWVLYLDIALPADDGPVFCQDNPYARG